MSPRPEPQQFFLTETPDTTGILRNHIKIKHLNVNTFAASLTVTHSERASPGNNLCGPVRISLADKQKAEPFIAPSVFCIRVTSTLFYRVRGKAVRTSVPLFLKLESSLKLSLAFFTAIFLPPYELFKADFR